MILIDGPIVLPFVDPVFSCDSPYVYGFVSNVLAQTHLYWDFHGDGIYDDSLFLPTDVNSIDTLFFTYDSIYRGSDLWAKIIAYNDSTLCYYEDSTDIYIRQIETGIIADDVGCVGETKIFDASPTMDESQTISCFPGYYQWDFGDNILYDTCDTYDTIFTSITAPHVYDNRGNYYVQLVATDTNGCRDTAIHHIKIYHPDIGFITSPKR